MYDSDVAVTLPQTPPRKPSTNPSLLQYSHLVRTVPLTRKFSSFSRVSHESGRTLLCRSPQETFGPSPGSGPWVRRSRRFGGRKSRRFLFTDDTLGDSGTLKQ